MEFGKVISAWVVFACDFVAPLHRLPIFLNHSVMLGFFFRFEMWIHIEHFLKIQLLWASQIGCKPAYYREEFSLGNLTASMVFRSLVSFKGLLNVSASLKQPFPAAKITCKKAHNSLVPTVALRLSFLKILKKMDPTPVPQNQTSTVGNLFSKGQSR